MGEDVFGGGKRRAPRGFTVGARERLPLGHLNVHEGGLGFVAVPDGGRRLASGSYDCSIKIWELAIGMRGDARES